MKDFLLKYYKVFLIIGIAALLIFYIAQVDMQLVFDYVYRVGWKIVAILVASASGYFCATIAWRLCFHKTEKSLPSLGKLFVIRQIGEALTLINPTNIVAGEYSKIHLLKMENVRKEDGYTSIILSRSLIILSYFALFIAVSSWFLVVHVSSQMLLITTFAIGLAVLMFFVLSSFLTSRRLLFYQTIKWFFEKLKMNSQRLNSLRRINYEVHLFYTKHKSLLLGAFIFSLLHWLLGTFEFYIILNALELPCTYQEALILELGVMIFKSVGGFIPGQVGIEEYGNKIMLQVIGIPGAEIWIAVSILRRARQLAWIGGSLLFLLLFYNSRLWKYSV